MRLISATLVLALAVGTLRGGEDPVTGYWKVNLFEDGQQMTYWLLKLENKAGKVSGSISPLKRIPPTTVDDLKLAGDVLRFTIRLESGVAFSFEGKVPKAGGKILFGSVARGPQMIPAFLEATTAKSAFELNRDLVAKYPADPRAVEAVQDLIHQARDNKSSPKDLQEWVDGVIKAAELYGPRWHQETSLRLVETLLAENMPNLTVTTAAKVEKAFDAKTSIDTQLRLYTSLAAGLRQLKQEQQAADIESKIDKLEVGAHQEYSQKPHFPAAKFAGRKGKSDRAVLVELFTGAQCPPCVAADLGFDALQKTYGPSEVVLLQYHLHIPGPDALTTPDTESRASYYEKFVEGTPTILFNGQPAAPGGGGIDDGKEKYKEYRDVIEPLLEKAAAATLQVKATRKGNVITIKASVADLAAAGPKTKLRMALVEDWVRYRGRNGLSFHHRVVRALPGGAPGLSLTKMEGDYATTVDLTDLKGKLVKYLDDFAKAQSPFPDRQRPLAFRNLHVVAFVQNDDSRDVLQAVDVPVKEE